MGGTNNTNRELKIYDPLAQRRGLNFSSRMSPKQLHHCNKSLKIFQITLKTAKFD
jgi:hypothetical protein